MDDNRETHPALSPNCYRVIGTGWSAGKALTEVRISGMA